MRVNLKLAKMPCSNFQWLWHYRYTIRVDNSSITQPRTSYHHFRNTRQSILKIYFSYKFKCSCLVVHYVFLFTLLLKYSIVGWPMWTINSFHVFWILSSFLLRFFFVLAAQLFNCCCCCLIDCYIFIFLILLSQASLTFHESARVSSNIHWNIDGSCLEFYGSWLILASYFKFIKFTF